jgi:hypothetical protein
MFKILLSKTRLAALYAFIPTTTGSFLYYTYTKEHNCLPFSDDYKVIGNRTSESQKQSNDYFESYLQIHEYDYKLQKFFQTIPKEYRTEEMYLKLINHNINYSTYIPQDELTQKICNLYSDKFIDLPHVNCNNIGKHFTEIPRKFRTSEFYINFIKKYECFFFLIPAKELTQEICDAYIRYSETHNNCDRIPQKYRNTKFYIMVVQKDETKFDTIPKHKLTQEICDAYVKCYPKIFNILNKIPQMYVNQDMIDTTVCDNNLRDIELLPEKYMSTKICDFIINNNKYQYYKLLPAKFSNKDMYERIVKIDPLNLQYVPRHLQSLEMCCDAIKKDINATKYVKDQSFYWWKHFEDLNWQDCINDAIISNVKLNPNNIKNISLWNTSLCYKLLQLNIVYLEHIPKAYQKSDMCIDVIMKDARHMKYIKITYDVNVGTVIRNIVTRNKGLIQYVPEQYACKIKTEENSS